MSVDDPENLSIVDRIRKMALYSSLPKRETVEAGAEDYAPDWRLCYLQDFIAPAPSFYKPTHHEHIDLRWFDAAATPEMRQELADRLRALPYKRFLRTRYWGIVRAWVVHERGSVCSECYNSHCVVDVHHRTYEHHGQEHLFPEDLRVICRNCHKGIHED